VPEFPLTASSTDILYSTIAGLASAIAGVIVQFYVAKKMAELRKQEIIEVI